MISTAIPKRYARALMAAARERTQDLEALSTEIGSFADLLRAGSEFHSFLLNPFIPASRKATLLEKLLKKTLLSPLAANFLRLLQKRNRLTFLPDIFLEFRRLADDLEGIVRGEVIAAADLPEPVLASLREALAARMSKKVILTVRKDPRVIGGIIVKIGSLSLDGSIRAHLDSMKDKLIEGVTV